MDTKVGRFLTKLFARFKPADYAVSPPMQEFYRVYRESRELADGNSGADGGSNGDGGACAFVAFVHYISEKGRGIAIDYAAVCEDLKSIVTTQSGSKSRTKKELMMMLGDRVLTMRYTPEDPDEEPDHTDLALQNIVTEMKNDGISVPAEFRDVKEGDDSKSGNNSKSHSNDSTFLRMRQYRDTYQTCERLSQAQSELGRSFSRIWLVDTETQFRHPMPRHIIVNEDMGDDPDDLGDEIINMQELKSNYRMGAPHTAMPHPCPVKIVSDDPVFYASNCRSPTTVYICSGSNTAVCGNAQHGYDVPESQLCMTSTYGYTMNKISSMFPAHVARAVVCPCVLVITDKEYNVLDSSKWQRIRVICAPVMRGARLVKPNTLHPDDRAKIKNGFSAFLELALFLGYDNIVLDDRAAKEHGVPVVAMASIIKEVTAEFSQRCSEITICVPDDNVRAVYKKGYRP